MRRAGTPMADKWAVTEFRGDWTLEFPNEQSFAINFKNNMLISCTVYVHLGL